MSPRQQSPLLGQYRTWFEHGIIAAAIPALATWYTGDLAAGFVVSFFTTMVFIIREGKHYRDHVKAGDWTTPEPTTGITPQQDQLGDLVGPISVLMTYSGLVAALL